MTERPNFNLKKPIDHLVLSVDTSDVHTAHSLMDGFAEAGGNTVKLGIEMRSARDIGGPQGLSELAEEHGLRWIYDDKIHDIGNTMGAGITNVVNYDYPPVGITMHSADTSLAGMEAAQKAAGDIPIFGVTLLTDIGPEEVFEDHADDSDRLLVAEFGHTTTSVGEAIRERIVLARAHKLARAGVGGLVASPKELSALKQDPIARLALTLIPGTRSLGADTHDQKNVMTPEDAISYGADLLVIGRQYTTADDKLGELERLREEVMRGLERRDLG
jgi:orotidine-5'-phosphate decarboxylase